MKMAELIMKLTIFFLIAPLASCAIVHRYGEFYGKVIDIETKEPLEGAAVLAVYYTEQPGPGGEVTHYADAQETLTDKNGEFKIPSNTVTTFRPLQYFEPYAWFTIFKPGYGCYPWHKGVKPMFVPNGTLPEKQYVIVELPKLKTREERIENYGCYPSEQVPEIKYKYLFQLIQQERVAVGLEPRKLPK